MNRNNQQLELLSDRLNVLYILADRFNAVKDKLEWEDLSLFRQAINKAMPYLEIANAILAEKAEADDDKKRVIRVSMERLVENIKKIGGEYGRQRIS